jgi:hypothetical protein
MLEQSGFSRFAACLSSITARTLTNLVSLGPLVLGLISVSEASLLAQAPTPVPVLTWRYDITHAGQNTSETALTPANVNVNSFGKLFSMAVDSSVYAQPLYVPGLKMSDGLVHNVIFIATENDSVYAFDADSNGGANANPIWRISMLDAAHGAGTGATPQQPADTGEGDIGPTIGITGTPAIDPATNTIYVVAATKESGVNYSRLHAINILNGAERAGSPVVVTASAPGTGAGSSGGQVSFSALYDNQRSALNFYNGYVYFGYAAHGDIGPWHGWLFAYNATTLKQSAALCLSPNDHGAGIWESGAGMPIDDDAPGGRMFVATGNGAVTSYPPFSASSNLSMSILDFSLANGGITPTDGFTSYNYETINSGDLDQGSGGVLMVPDQQGTYPHILVEAGKEGRILVLNRDNLGGYNVGGTSNPHALQDITGALTYAEGLWSTPAYWNGNVYLWSEKNVPMLFKLNSGVMDTAPDSKSTITSGFPGASFSISSNGTQDGIAWAVRSDQFSTNGPAVLYAWDANDLTNTIYESDTDPTRDAAGIANKFSVPVVTDGKVYLVANGEVDVYGLFNGEPTAVAPTISPNGGTFASGQKVTLSTTTASAEIFYTLDGSTPTTASTQYTDPIEIATDTTLKAIASAPGYIQSAVRSAKFTFSDQTPPITLLPAGGTYLNAQHVTISDPNTKAKIYYTTDGSTPSASSKLYTGPIRVAVSETIKAVAIYPGLVNSNIGTAVYVIQEGGSTIDFGSGFASSAGLVFNGSALATNDTRLQLTNGALWEAGSVYWDAPINVQAFTTDFEFQLSNAQGNGFTFTLQNMGLTALGGDSAGLGYQNIQKSVAIKFNFYNYEGEGSNSTGIYTDGEPPLLPTVDITPSGIELGGGDAIEAHLTYNGTTLTLNLHDPVTNDSFTKSWTIDIPKIVGANTAYVGFTGGTGGLSASQKLLNWTYSTQSVPPTFAPRAGTYTAPQKVTLSSATANAAIYYTTNRTAPNATSTVYSGPIPVVASETIEAVAISPAAGSSSIASAAYVIHDSKPTFLLSSAVEKTVVQGHSTASTITVTPSGGFTGKVTLKCAVTKRSGAIDEPTCSITQPAAISGAKAETATLTIDTRSATSPGSYTLTVTGSSRSATDTTSVAIDVSRAPAARTFALTGTPVSIAPPGKSGTSVITITPKNGFTGSVTLECVVTGPSDAVDKPTCSASKAADISEAKAVTLTLKIDTKAATSHGDYTATVTGRSGDLTATTKVEIAVSATTDTSEFTLSSESISIASPGNSGTSTITITPKEGFTGSVTLECDVTGPSNAVDAPTCSLSKPAAISETKPVTSTLTIHTTAATAAALHHPLQRIFTPGSSGTLAALLFFWLPLRRRKGRALASLLALVVIAAAASGCGTYVPMGSSSSGDAGDDSGTTAGTYEVSVTGTSGSAHATTSVAVTVH